MMSLTSSLQNMSVYKPHSLIVSFPDDTATIGESTVATSQQPTETTVSAAAVSTKAAIETIVGDVDISHPEVQVMVDAAVKEAESQTYTLASEAYVEVLQEAITEIHKELRKKDSNGPTYVYWWF